MENEEPNPGESPPMPEGKDRREFLEHAATITMAGGLAAGYGMLGSHATRFLYPANVGESIWQFVCTLDELSVGESLPFTLPSGAKIVIARQQEGESADSFIALSSICPHLGCKVHWEASNDRFFCPCHNGAFDAQGAPTEGPPAAANQHLTRFDLTVEGVLLMVRVPLGGISTDGTGESA